MHPVCFCVLGTAPPQAVGLHAGWAVEGVVGSVFKTDATYIGANADLPVKLADAAQRAGVGVMMSSDFSVRTTLARLLLLLLLLFCAATARHTRQACFLYAPSVL